jgi:hypothetical protein
MLTNDAGETTRSVCSVLRFENSQELEALTRPYVYYQSFDGFLLSYHPNCGERD